MYYLLTFFLNHYHSNKNKKMSLIPTPPSFVGDWSINLESQVESQSQSEEDQIDDKIVELPGLGNCLVQYIDSQAPDPPETLTESLTLDLMPGQCGANKTVRPEEEETVQIIKQKETQNEESPAKKSKSKLEFEMQLLI